VAAVLGVGATGCGSSGDDGERDAIETRLTSLQSAFAANSPERVCRHLTERAVQLISWMAHEVSADCPAAVKRIRTWMGNGEREVVGARPKLTDVEVKGRQATATVERPDSAPYSVRFAEAKTGWKLDGVFDAGTSTFQEHSNVPFDSGPPPEPADADADEGTPVEPTRPAEIEVVDAPVNISVLNLFGRMPLSRCTLHMTLEIDASGATRTDDFYVGGENACGDIRGCDSNEMNSRHAAWTGRIERAPDGALQHRFDDVCLDTCVGMYRGSWTVGLERTAKGWRLRSDGQMVGRTGWIFDGSMPARGDELEVAST
jgi:hypothetical protein